MQSRQSTLWQQSKPPSPSREFGILRRWSSLSYHDLFDLHLPIWTRPDIAWIIIKLCQSNHDPSDLHMTAPKYLMRYGQDTLDYSFTYSFSQWNSLYNLFDDYESLEIDSTPLHGYSDASGASGPHQTTRNPQTCRRCQTSAIIRLSLRLIMP